MVVGAPGVDNKPQPTNQHHSIITHRIRIVQITVTSLEVFFRAEFPPPLRQRDSQGFQQRNTHTGVKSVVFGGILFLGVSEPLGNFEGTKEAAVSEGPPCLGWQTDLSSLLLVPSHFGCLQF